VTTGSASGYGCQTPAFGFSAALSLICCEVET
jgi:hypothetical protein